MTSDNILPTIGSAGSFKLLAPFDKMITDGVRYTCQAIRTLNDYLANNENPKTDIYDLYKIPETDYDKDLQENMHIVSLQSDIGHWLYVPARYIATYPLVNGTPYRSFAMVVSLPSFPTDRDLSFLQTEVNNLCKDTLGVVPQTKFVETSRVVLVSAAKHNSTSAERNLTVQNKGTDRARYIDLLYKHNQALTKIAELEKFIKSKY
jgi:hypothetical protein